MGMVGDGGAALGNAVGAVSRGSVGTRRASAEGPRERLLRLGAQALTDPELLAILFNTGTKGNPVLALAEALLNTGGGLRALAQSDPHDLCELPGLGPARAAQVLAALELGLRVQRSTETRPRLCTPQQIFQHVWPALCTLRREVFHVLCLNARNVLLADHRVSLGTQSFCPVDPRDVFRAALTSRAAALVLVHNHPSGDPKPSSMDLTLTRQLMSGARLLGIKVLDHLVVGDGRYHSMLEQGDLRPIEAALEGAGWHERGGGS